MTLYITLITSIISKPILAFSFYRKRSLSKLEIIRHKIDYKEAKKGIVHFLKEREMKRTETDLIRSQSLHKRYFTNKNIDIIV